MEDWVIYVENIATQRFEKLAHEMKVTKVAPDRVEKLKSQVRLKILDDDMVQLSNTDGRMEVVRNLSQSLMRAWRERCRKESKSASLKRSLTFLFL